MRLVWLNPIAGFEIFYLCLFYKVMCTVFCKKNKFQYNHRSQELFDMEKGENANEKRQKSYFILFQSNHPGVFSRVKTFYLMKIS